MPDWYPIVHPGQGAGMIDSVPPAAEIVRAVVNEAQAALRAALNRVEVNAPA